MASASTSPRTTFTGGPAGSHRLGQVVFIVALTALSVWCAWLLYVNLNGVVGPRAFVYAALFACAPVAPLVMVFLWLDRLRPEPTRFLVIALLWGAIIAAYAALRVNGWMAIELGDRYGASPRSAVFVAPWVEEACKAAVIFALAWWRRHDFNGAVAGVVYGGLTGIGFAFTENVVYYGQIFQRVQDLGNDNGAAIDAVQSLFIWRGVAAPFIHPMFTVMTGIGIGIAVRHRHVGIRVVAPVVGYCAAVLLHMSYNTAASFVRGEALVAVYVGILVPTLLVLSVVVGAIRRHERQVIAARLNDYTAFGWLQPEQIPPLVGRHDRRALRRQAKPLGRAEQDRVRALQATGVDLGILRDRLVRGVAGERERDRETELIARLRSLMGRVALPDGQSPRAEPVPVPSSW